MNTQVEVVDSVTNNNDTKYNNFDCYNILNKNDIYITIISVKNKNINNNDNKYNNYNKYNKD